MDAAIASISDKTAAVSLEGLIAGGIFTLISAGVLGFGHYLGVTHERDEALKARFPNAPWKWKLQWHDNDIKSNSKLQLVVMACVTAAFVVVSALITPAVWNMTFEDKEYISAVFLLFPVISLFALYTTYRLYRRWRRFERSIFRMASLPAPIGHVLKGQLVLAEQPPKDSVFKFKLQHSAITVQRSGGENRRSKSMLWEDAQDIPTRQGSYSTHFRLPVVFQLPKNTQSSDWADSQLEYVWELNVKADLPGPDYEQTFEIPVYDPDRYDFHVPHYLNEDGGIAGNIYQDPGDWRETHVEVTKTPEGETYYCPPARYKGMALTVTFIALFMGVIPIALFHGAGLFVSLFFGPFVALFALIFTAIALDMWFHKIFLVVNKGRLNIRYGLFARKQISCSFDEISDLKVKSTMQSETTAYYDIIADLKGGRSIKLAIYLDDKRDATALRDKIASGIGL